MSYLNKVFFILMVLGQLVALNSWAVEVPSLLKIQGQRINNDFVTELHFDREIKNIEKYTVDFINETIQVNVPAVNFNKQKEFSRIEDSSVRNLYTYTVSDEMLRHRIILKKGNSSLRYEDKVDIVAEGSVLKIRVSDVKVMAKSAATSTTLLKSKNSNLSGIDDIIQALPAKNTQVKNVQKKTNERKEKVVFRIDEEQELKAEELRLIAAIEEAHEKDIKNEGKPQGSIQVKANEKYNEKNIPVLVKSKIKKAGTTSTYGRMIISFIIILLMGGGILFYIKKYAHKKQLKNKHTHIKVMTQHYLGPKKSLAIVNVAGESILVGITDQNISHIKTLSLIDDEFPEVVKNDFSTTLNKTISTSADQSNVTSSISSQQKISNENKVVSNIEDEFSMNGIKDLVSSRLKGMREL